MKETGSGEDVETSSNTCSCSSGESGFLLRSGQRVRSTEEKLNLKHKDKDKSLLFKLRQCTIK